MMTRLQFLKRSATAALTFGPIASMLTGCATLESDAAAITTTAQTFASNLPGYLQTLAKGLQTIAGLATATAPLIEALASQWGLLPATSSQANEFNKIVNYITSANGDLADIEAFITSIGKTGAVPTTPATTGIYHYRGLFAKE